MTENLYPPETSLSFCEVQDALWFLMTGNNESVDIKIPISSQILDAAWH